MPATAVRQRRRRADSYLDQTKIRAAWDLYKGGWTVPEIAERLWEQYGFTSEASCRLQVYKAFWRNGYRLRSCGESQRHGYRACSRCGGPSDKKTRGCITCVKRQWNRRQRESRR